MRNEPGGLIRSWTCKPGEERGTTPSRLTRPRGLNQVGRPLVPAAARRGRYICMTLYIPHDVFHWYRCESYQRIICRES